MSWGISENASEKEKLKAEVNDYFHGLNSVGKIDYKAYSELYDVCMPILEECYDRMEKYRKAESEEWVNFADDLIPIIDETKEQENGNDD